MSATSLEIQPAVPGEFMADEIVSTSQAILRKELIPIFPENNSTFTETNKEIRIHIDDSDSYLFTKESYLLFTLNVNDYGLTFPDGGCGSLFNDIEMRINKTSIQLDRWEYHNFENGVNCVLNDDPDVIAASGYASGDTVTDLGGTFESSVAVTITAAGANNFEGVAIDAAEYVGHVVAATALRILGLRTGNIDVSVGDIFVNDAAATQMIVCTGVARALTDPSDGESFRFRSIGVTEAAAGTYTKVKNVRAISTGNFTYKIPLDAMNINWPLFLLPGGINLILRLAAGELAFNVLGGRANYNTTYTISNVKFMAMLVTPHIDLKNKAIDDFNGRGLVYGYQGVRTKFIPMGSGADQNLDVNWGIRSARKVISYLTTDAMAFNSGIPRAANSITHYPKAGITQYQYKVGIHFFPRRELDCTNAREMMRQIYNCNKMKLWRVRDNDLLGNASYIIGDFDGARFDARRFLMVADLSRYNGDFSEMTGIDLTIAHLQLEIKESNGNLEQFLPGNGYIVMHVVHDKYVRLHATNISVIQ